MPKNKKTTPPTAPLPLRVWWIPQVPMQAFRVDVKTVDEAKLLLNTLAQYDIFQFENHVKADYCNAGGLEELIDGEWQEWSDENGDQIDDLLRAA